MTAPTGLTAAVYPLAYRHMGRGRLGDLLTADVRIMLVTSGYTPTDTDEFVTTPGIAEARGASYYQGGMQLQNRGFDLNTTTGKAVLTADPILFAAAGWTARYAVVYVNNLAGYQAAPLISRIDLGTDVSPAGDDYTLTFSGGVLAIGAGT